MRFNTKSKRIKAREQMVRNLHRQGYMYNNSAEEIVDKWIEEGSKSFPANGVVWEALELAKINYVYQKKNGLDTFSKQW